MGTREHRPLPDLTSWRARDTAKERRSAARALSSVRARRAAAAGAAGAVASDAPRETHDVRDELEEFSREAYAPELATWHRKETYEVQIRERSFFVAVIEKRNACGGVLTRVRNLTGAKYRFGIFRRCLVEPGFSAERVAISGT
jgi:hypothetical protein